MWGRSHARMLETLLSINWKMKVRFNRDFGKTRRTAFLYVVKVSDL